MAIHTKLITMEKKIKMMRKEWMKENIHRVVNAPPGKKFYIYYLSHKSNPVFFRVA